MCGEPKAPDPDFLRLTSKMFPPYRFIPGLNPHPVRDPLGHSYGHSPAALSYLPPKQWRENGSYLYGVDLYNHAHWWEAHEAWEDVWHTTDKGSAQGQFLQGLIQISAAFIKWHLHQFDGLKKLYELGIARLEGVCVKNPQFMGVDLEAHIAKLKKHFYLTTQSEPQNWPDWRPHYPFLIVH
jgi:hypothetical protein